jgi:antitoxin VapB
MCAGTPATGDVILSRRPESWEDFFEMMKNIDVPSDFLADRDDAPHRNGNFFNVRPVPAGHQHF